MSEMDEELKAQFLERFQKELKGVLDAGEKNLPKSIIDFRSAEWMFTKIPKFVEDVFNVGIEVGELSGRMKGYDQGIKDQQEKQKKIEQTIIKLN